MTVAMLRCACERCSCEVQESQAVVRHGQSFCSEACAMGHPNHEPCHGNGSCGCTCADWAVQAVSVLLIALGRWIDSTSFFCIYCCFIAHCDVWSRASMAPLKGPDHRVDASSRLNGSDWSMICTVALRWLIGGVHWQIARRPVVPFPSAVTI